MKNEKFLAAIGALQPFLWFVIYNIFYPAASKNGTSQLLKDACFVSCLLLCFVLIVPGVVRWWMDEEKKEGK